MIVLANNLLPASVIAYACCFLLTFVFLRGRAKLFDRLMISSATMISGIWLFEIAYHYSWGLGGLPSDLTKLSIALGGPVPFPIYFAIALVALPLLARQYITLNIPFLIILTLSLVLFGAWVGMGFPQFWCNCENRTVFGTLIPNPLIENAGYVMNSLTKILSVVPAFLFYGASKSSSEKSELVQSDLSVENQIPSELV